MDAIVTAKWLMERMERGGEGGRPVTVVDCRFQLGDPEAGRRAYEEKHIAGAYYADLERDLSAPKRPDGAGGRHPLPEPEELAAFFSRIGIGPGVDVVAYDDQGGSMASRLWWLLRWMGHDGGAYVLEGGFAGWQAAGGAVSSEEPPAAAGVAFVPRVRGELAASQADVRARLGQPGVVLVDSREAPRYRGEAEPIDPVAGHIPGAVNRFWKDALDEAGRWRPAAEQRARFADAVAKAAAEAGLAEGEEPEIIVYCGSGVTACPNVLALEGAGFRRVKLYAGSWSDWISYKGNPVATGEE